MNSISPTNDESFCRRLTASLVLFIFTFAFASCAKRSRAPSPTTASAAAESTSTAPIAQRININTASAKELEALPGIGKGLAERIVEHREQYGPFRRAEHLMMVRGISDTRFRALRHLITVE